MERFNFLTQKSRQWGWMCVTFQHFVDFPYVAELLAVWRRNRQMCTQTEIVPDSRLWVVGTHTSVCACASPQIERGWMVLSCSQSWGVHVATNRQEGLSGSPGAARPLALLAKLTWPILWGHLAPRLPRGSTPCLNSLLNQSIGPQGDSAFTFQRLKLRWKKRKKITITEWKTELSARLFGLTGCLTIVFW